MIKCKTRSDKSKENILSTTVIWMHKLFRPLSVRHQKINTRPWRNLISRTRRQVPRWSPRGGSLCWKRRKNERITKLTARVEEKTMVSQGRYLPSILIWFLALDTWDREIKDREKVCTGSDRNNPSTARIWQLTASRASGKAWPPPIVPTTTTDKNFVTYS